MSVGIVDPTKEGWWERERVTDSEGERKPASEGEREREREISRPKGIERATGSFVAPDSSPAGVHPSSGSAAGL